MSNVILNLKTAIGAVFRFKESLWVSSELSQPEKKFPPQKLAGGINGCDAGVRGVYIVKPMPKLYTVPSYSLPALVLFFCRVKEPRR